MGKSSSPQMPDTFPAAWSRSAIFEHIPKNIGRGINCIIIKCYGLFSQLTSGRDWWPQLGPRRVASAPGAFFVSAVMVNGSLTVCTDSAPHHQVRGFRWAEPAVSGHQRSLFRFAPALNAYAKQGRRMKSARQKSQHALVIPGSLLATSVHADPGARSRSQALSIPIGLMQLLGRTVAGVQSPFDYV
jgi:hypothetical protein